MKDDDVRSLGRLAPAAGGRILLESTSAYSARFTTGIQRVVRSIIYEAGSGAPQRGASCVPVILRGGQLYDARQAWRRRAQQPACAACQPVHLLGRCIDRVSRKAARRYASALLRLRKALYPTTFARAVSNQYWKRFADKVTFLEGDVLLLLDESWSLPIWPVVDQAKRQGCRVGALIYDLIPIDHPEFFENKFAERFASWLEELIEHADFFLAISETVADRLRSYIARRHGEERASATAIAAFSLGGGISGDAAADSVDPRVRLLFPGDRSRAPYLCVGTLEPRKNHRYLLEAFDIVWQRCPQARLCIAGRVGWKCDEVLSLIESHPQFGRSLFLFNDLNDGELRHCYQGAKTLIAPSIAEGFGLPILEGLQHGLPVLASDIPIHHEAGGSSCGYFDLRRPQSLAALVLEIELGGIPPRPIAESTKMRTWRQSCSELVAKILDMQAARTSGRHTSCARPWAAESATALPPLTTDMRIQ